MSHNFVTHSCGHQVDYNLDGNKARRAYQMRKMEAQLCRNCQFESDAATAIKWAADNGFAPLTGRSERQMQFGEMMRKGKWPRIIRELNAIRALAEPDGAVYRATQELEQKLRTCNEAARWLDWSDRTIEVGLQVAILDAVPTEWEEIDPRRRAALRRDAHNTFATPISEEG